MSEIKTITNALISVFHKDGLAPIVRKFIVILKSTASGHSDDPNRKWQRQRLGYTTPPFPIHNFWLAPNFEECGGKAVPFCLP